MRSRRIWSPILVAVLACLASACAPSTRVASAREFIANYSDAMVRKSASRVLAMEADGPLMQRFARTPEQRAQLGRFDPDQRRGELERLFQKEDIWWKAWTQTRYAGERVHDDHLDVEVAVSGAFSQVILVRADDGTLRLHSLPGWVHAQAPGNRNDTEGVEGNEGPSEEPALEEAPPEE